MGKVVKITCEACGKNWENRVGSGIRHSSLDTISGEYEDATAEEIRMLAKQNKFVLYDFSFYMAKCSHCREIVSVPFLSLKEGGKCFEGCCPVCGRMPEIIEEIDLMKCPTCNADGLKKDMTGRWD